MPLWYSKPTPEINLTWTASVSGTIVGYNIYRSLVGATGPFTLLAFVPLPATSYLDIQVNPLQTYWYELTSTDGFIESAPTSVIAVTTLHG